MTVRSVGTCNVDTGLRIAGKNIVGSSDAPRYHIRGSMIRSRRGDTGFYIEGQKILGPDGDSGFRIAGGRIVGPSATAPWEPHADGSEHLGPGY